MADPAQRARLVALYILDLDWRAATAQPNALAGEIRLAWWREAVERVAAGGPPDHPALEAFGQEAVRQLEPELVAALDAYTDREIGGASAAVRAAAVKLLDPNSTVQEPSVQAFPALAHLALAPVYARGRTPGELEKRLRITWAVLRGRL